jgi:hypothetical protein
VSKLSKPTVELQAPARPSRIRRDPPPAPEKVRTVRAYPSEREVLTVVIGVVLFAVAIVIITFGISDYTAG